MNIAQIFTPNSLKIHLNIFLMHTLISPKRSPTLGFVIRILSAYLTYPVFYACPAHRIFLNFKALKLFCEWFNYEAPKNSPSIFQSPVNYSVLGK